MAKIQLHDPMKHVLHNDTMFHAQFFQALKQNRRTNWVQRIRGWFGL